LPHAQVGLRKINFTAVRACDKATDSFEKEAK